MEELGVGGFFSVFFCDRVNYIVVLVLGFEIGKYIVLKCVLYCVNRFYFENFRWWYFYLWFKLILLIVLLFSLFEWYIYLKNNFKVENWCIDRKLFRVKKGFEN